MVQILQAQEITLAYLETYFQLHLTENPDFFLEWNDCLPEITDWQKQLLDRVKAGYLNLLKKPPFLEKAVNMAVVAPLLFIGEFYLSPFELRTEKSVEIEVTETIQAQSSDREIRIKGNLDTLILHDRFWLMTIESKQARFAVEAGLAQILAYMLASPGNPVEQPCFGMITNGGSFIFVKLLKTALPRYALSDLFGIRNDRNHFYDVLRILKRLLGDR